MRKEWENRSTDSAVRLPKDPLYIGIGLVIYCILCFITKNYLSKFLIKKFAKSKKIPDIPMKKFTRALWKGISFTILMLWGIYSLWGESWVLSPLGITMEWKNNKTPWQINMHYIVATVYYTGSFVTMFLEEKQSDFYLMIWHHFVTLVLMGFSYHLNFLRFGTFLMLLHDVADPWMEAAKITVYLGYQSLGNVLFLIFSIMFIVPRIFIYAYMIIIPGYFFLFEYGSHLLVPIWGLLIAVLLLNSYWSVLILRMLLEFLSRGKVDKDIRDTPQGNQKGNQKGNPSGNSYRKPAGKPVGNPSGNSMGKSQKKK
ncbi:very-long-chain ceramide synthase [Nematocida sp. LUAm3]|nr:very-long-chain ceramide synthase [Nematocida sp. LUAm3]